MENENLILEYLRGNLSHDENVEFLKRLENEPTLKEEYIIIRNMYSNLQEKKYKSEYTSKIEALGNKHFRQTEINSTSNQLKYLLSAIVLMLLLIASYIYFSNKINRDLYHTHSDHFALHLVLKNNEKNEALEAERAFNNRQFEMASELLIRYLNNNSFDTKAKLALGVSYLELDQYEKAVAVFDEISSGTSTLKYQAKWFKALYFVKIQDLNKAKSELLLIPSEQTQLHNKAQSLIQDIELITK